MSHYYSRIQGHRGEATRCGTKSSGITATATGWDIGGDIDVKFSPQLQTDIVYLYRTGGSNKRTRTLVAAFANINGVPTCINTNYPELLI
ncbi:MAG: hypothetical protein ACYDD5_00830 [Sulfuricurvum sp.]